MSSSSSSTYLGYISLFFLVFIQTGRSISYAVSNSAGSYDFSPLSAICMAECVKGLLSIFSLQKMHGPVEAKAQLRMCFARGKEGLLLPRIAVLAAMYCLNNQLEFVLYTIFDPAFVTLVKAAMPVLIALFSLLLGIASLRVSQLINLLVACLSLFCARQAVNSSGGGGSSMVGADTTGWVLVITHVTIAALNSVWNENTLNACDASLNAHNTFLYLFGFIFNGICFMLSSEPRGFFQGYNSAGLMVIFVNSIIGIAISGVFKYLGAIAGSLASSLSAVLVLFVSWKFLGHFVSLVSLLCSVVTICAIFLHFFSVNRHFDLYLGVGSSTLNSAEPPSKPPKKGRMSTRKLIMASLVPALIALSATMGLIAIPTPR